MNLDEMREHLSKFTTDTVFIEQTILRLSRQDTPKRKVEMLPPKAEKPVPTPEEKYLDYMQQGSERLAEAISVVRQGIDPRTPSVLIWRSSTGADMPNWSGERDIIERVYPEPINRDPCSYCGTRRDIGCKHTKVNS